MNCKDWINENGSMFASSVLMLTVLKHQTCGGDSSQNLIFVGNPSQEDSSSQLPHQCKLDLQRGRRLFFFFFFLGPHPKHMEVPGLGIKSELQLLAFTTATATLGSPTHGARPGMEPTSSWILVGFVSAAPQWKLLRCIS